MNNRTSSHIRYRPRLMSAVALVLALLVGGAASAWCQQFTLESVDTTQFPVNYVYYRHIDAQGSNAGPIWEDNLDVSEGDYELRAHTDDEGENVPADLAIVIDSSGSMEDAMDGVLGAAHSLIGRLDDADQAEIVDFDTVVRRLTGFSGDKDLLRSALEPVRPEGATALYDAIELARGDLAGRTGLKAVVVLTDGKDERGTGKGRMSELDLDSLLARLNSSPIPVFAIGLGSGVDRSVLDVIADASRGEVFYADEVDAVEGIYEEIISYLHSLYRFYYVSRDADRDGGGRTVTVRARLETGPAKRARADYRAPSGDHWSYATSPDADHRVGSVAISPDGATVWMVNEGRVINREGEVFAMTRKEYDAYGATATNTYASYWSHWTYGAVLMPEGDGIGEIEAHFIYNRGPSGDPVGEDWSPNDGTFNPDFSWNFKALSPGERYALLATDIGTDRWPEATTRFHFALMDFRTGEVLWMQPLSATEFNEPGAVAVADDGTALISQGDIFSIVARDGTVIFRSDRRVNGKRYAQVAISADGAHWVGRLHDREVDGVEMYDADGSILWSVDSEQEENDGGVAISPNGRYVAVNDGWGLRVFDAGGNLLLERATDEFVGGWQLKGVGIANDGSYAYALGNRVVYGQVPE